MTNLLHLLWNSDSQTLTLPTPTNESVLVTIQRNKLLSTLMNICFGTTTYLLRYIVQLPFCAILTMEGLQRDIFINNSIAKYQLNHRVIWRKCRDNLKILTCLKNKDFTEGKERSIPVTENSNTTAYMTWKGSTSFKYLALKLLIHKHLEGWYSNFKNICEYQVLSHLAKLKVQIFYVCSWTKKLLLEIITRARNHRYG